MLTTLAVAAFVLAVGLIAYVAHDKADPWACLLALSIVAAPSTVRGQASNPDNSVSILAGSIASTSGDTSGITLPFVHVGAVVRLADADMAPRLRVDVDLTGLPGQEISLESPETFRAVEAKVGISQRPYRSVGFALFAEAGSAMVLARDQGQARKWACGGVRIDRTRGSLAIGVGADQRLGGYYQPAVIVYGGVRLYERFGVGVWLVGQASIGIADYGRDTPSDLVRVGVAIGR